MQDIIQQNIGAKITYPGAMPRVRLAPPICNRLSTPGLSSHGRASCIFWG